MPYGGPNWSCRSCRSRNREWVRMSAVWGPHRRLLLEQFIRGFELFYADNDLCTVWARIRADARAAGRPMSPQDAWIAATALALDAPLATNNQAGLRTRP